MMTGTYEIIYADPPWRYSAKKVQGAAENHYPTMSIDELSALPVAELAALTRPFLDEDLKDVDASRLEAAVGLYQQRANTLVELAKEVRAILLPAAALEYAAGAKEKALTAESRPHLAALRDIFAALRGDQSLTELRVHNASRQA